MVRKELISVLPASLMSMKIFVDEFSVELFNLRNPEVGSESAVSVSKV